MVEKKRGLGKGLAALIPEGVITPVEEEFKGSRELSVLIDKVKPNPYQPRTAFDKEKLQELADSIKENGVFSPILVRPKNGGYELIAGERRLRAASMAGLKEIPALVKELTDEKSMELAIIENVQREDLNTVEEAKAYKRLATEFQMTQEEIAKKLGKSRPYVANIVRLLSLPESVLKLLEEGKLSQGHVRPLLALEPHLAAQIANRLVEDKGTAREAELWAKQGLPAKEQEAVKAAASKEKKETKKEELPLELKKIREVLRNTIHTKVDIQPGTKGGKILIDYYTDDDLERILELITGKTEVE